MRTNQRRTGVYKPITFARALRAWACLLACCMVIVVGSLLVGGAGTSLRGSFAALLSHDESLAATIVYELRLPRTLAAFGTGGLLALSGGLMQILLRNPLADPYILGLSGGAATGALGAMLLGSSVLLVNTGAAVGALTSSLLIFVLANGDLMRLRINATGEDSPRLILTGVMLASGWAALVALILVMAPDRDLRGMLFWAMGDLSSTSSYAPSLVCLAILLVVLTPFLRQFNVLLRGDAVAATLGVRVGLIKSLIFVVASIATATAVTTAGTIGFVGLVVPHALRKQLGNDQRVLLPACAIAGGGLLVLADTAARIAVDPLQLPVGAVMALIGVPLFLYMLRRGH